MAKKLRKPKTSLRLLFVELLIPWILMAFVAATMSLVLGLPDYASIIIALAGALAATFLIQNYEKKKHAARPR